MIVTDDDGTCTFPPINNASEQIPDGSGMTINVTDGPSASVTLKSGQVLNVPVTTSAASTTQTDTNGNEITSSTNGSTTTFLDTISDSTGTQVPVLTINGSGNTTGPVTYGYTSPAGTPANVTVTYKSYQVQTAFGCSGVTEYPATQQYLVDRVTLPDASYYQFSYEQTPIQGSTNVTARIASIQLPAGGTFSYNYQGFGNNGVNCTDGSTAGFVRTTPDGQWTYSRTGTSPNYTTTVTDPQGNQTVINFSGLYEISRSVYKGTASATPLEQVTTCYNGTTSSPCPTGTVTPPFSQITVEQSFNGGPQSRVDTQYDGYENLTEKDEYDFGAPSPSRKTTILYASLGNGINNHPSSVKVTDGAGNTKSYTTYFYDQFALQPSSIGTSQNHVNPATGTPRGNLTTVTTSTGASTSLSHTLTYYDTGKVYTATDVNSAVTNYTYGACAGAFPTTVNFVPLNLSTTATWNCTGGVMTSSLDANQQPTSYQYKNDSSFWRPDNMTDALSNVTAYTYTAPTPTTPAQAESALTFGSSTVDVLATLDTFGRVQFLQRKQAPTSTYYDTVYSTYDSLGRPYSVTVPYQGTAKQNGGSGSATTTYDAMSRPTATQDGGGALLNFTYTLNDVYREVAPKPGSDNNTKRRNLEYDGLGRLTSVCEVTSATNDTYWGACNQKVAYNGYLTTYKYDVAPNYNSVNVVQNSQKGTSQARSYVYDMIGRLTYESNPETGQTYYFYDNAPANSPGATCVGTYNGDLVKKYDAQGNTICYTYDALNRVTSVSYPAGPNSAASPQKNFVYDVATASGFSLSNTKARLSEAYTGTSSNKQTDLVFSYSGRGEVTDTWESTPHSSGYYHITQAYWPNGVVKTLNSFLGLPTISYGVDGEGRIANATASSGQNPASLVTYNTSISPAGALSQVTFGSGDYDTYTYIPATGRFQKYTFNVGSPAQTVKGALTWNTNGTINNLTISDQFNSADSQNCLYSYDDLGRIATANCGPLSNQTFTFDPFGNIIKNATAGTSFVPTYNLSKNQYSSVPSCSPAGGPSYDLNGNPTNDCEHAYTYSAENQPVSIDTSNTFVYDAVGRMVELDYTGGNTEYVYGPTGEELALSNGQTLQKAMIRLPGGGEAIYKVVSGSVTISHYRHADWLGSARFSSTPTQTLYYDIAYAPYGETYATLIGSGGNNSVVFAGQGKDTTTDLYPFTFRQYNSIQSRWVWPDPAGLGAVDTSNPQTWNRYAYVHNIPLTIIDPLGLWAWSDANFCKVACGGGGVDPGAIFINNAIQDFYAQAGLNSPIQQALQGWYQQEVDAGFANLQQQGSSNGGGGGGDGGDGSGGGYTIIVHCGGTLGDVICQPPAQAVDASQPYSTNLRYPGLAPGDVPVGFDLAHCAGCAAIWRNASGAANTALIATGLVVTGVPVAAETGVLSEGLGWNVAGKWGAFRQFTIYNVYGNLLSLGIDAVNGWHIGVGASETGHSLFHIPLNPANWF